MRDVLFFMHYLNCDNKNTVFAYGKHKKTIRSVCDSQFYAKDDRSNGISSWDEIKLKP